MRKSLWIPSGTLAVVLALTVVGFGERSAAQILQVPPVIGDGFPPPSWAPGAVTVGPGNIEVLPVQGQVYAVTGDGANMLVQAGDDGLLIVDTGSGEKAEQVLATIQQRFNKIIRFIINTTPDLDHISGNAKIAKAGVAVVGGGGANAAGLGNLGGAPAGAQIWAHENLLNRLSAPTGEKSALPFEYWPTDSFFTDEKQLFFNGEAIQILHQPAAHTNGDVMVFFRRSDVVASGDIFSTRSFPVFDPSRGGSFTGFLAALNRLTDLTIPDFKQEGGTYVVPGHGHIVDEADVVEYRDMTTIIRDRIQDLVNKGMTLEQVKAAKTTLDYNGRYQKTQGDWTPDRFVEAVYKELSAQKAQKK